MAKLVIHEGGRETVHEILESSLVIGRKEGVAVRVTDPEAGTEHCQLSVVPGVGYKLVDLESRAGRPRGSIEAGAGVPRAADT